MLRLREYRPEDFEILWQVDQQCFPDGISYTRLELEHYIHQRSAYTVIAETEDAVAAFAVADCPPRRTGRRRAGHVITIDVLPQFRRSGVGQQLMEHMEDRMRQSGCEVSLLEVAVNNENAIRFYHRLGYRVLRTLPRYYLRSIDALRMAKPLAAAEGRAGQAC